MLSDRKIGKWLGADQNHNLLYSVWSVCWCSAQFLWRSTMFKQKAENESLLVTWWRNCEVIQVLWLHFVCHSVTSYILSQKDFISCTIICKTLIHFFLYKLADETLSLICITRRHHIFLTHLCFYHMKPHCNIGPVSLNCRNVGTIVCYNRTKNLPVRLCI